MSQNPIITKYDDELCKLNCFSLRRFQLPHIGNNLVESGGVLFIMESHYINPGFFEHQYDKDNLKLEDPKLFYNINEDGLLSRRGFQNDN